MFLFQNNVYIIAPTNEEISYNTVGAFPAARKIYAKF